MKKTHRIQLVLITAALASCDRPLYQQGPDYPSGASGYPRAAQSTESAQASATYPRMGDEPDSSNSCPLDQSLLPPDFYLWYAGLRPFDFYYGSGFSMNGYYFYKSAPATIVRAGFGRSARVSIGH